MNYEFGIVSRGKNRKKKNSSRHSRFTLRDSAAPPRLGFALLFAVLAITVLLSISIAILNISLREVILSSFGRESQVAFYAADAGAECALYWSIKGAFATSTDSGAATGCPGPSQISINCGVFKLTPNISYCDKFSAITNFSLDDGVCVDVTVSKNGLQKDGTITTQIDSRGHNTCDQNSPTFVERGLKFNYQASY